MEWADALHGSIGDLQNLNALDASRGPHLDDIAFARFQKRPGDRRHPADFVELRTRFVDAYDPNRLFFAPRVTINNFRAEIDPLPILLPRGIDGFGDFHSFAEKPHSSVDLPQAPLAVNIVAIFRPVAIAGGPGHRLDGFRTLDFLQLGKLVLEPLKALGRDVIFGSGRKRGD